MMRGYLIDTNVISELRKGKRAQPAVRSWVKEVPVDQIFLSVLSLAEIRKGIMRVHARDPVHAARLETWREHLEREYARFDRLLRIDAAVAKRWGELQGGRDVPVIDCFLAATAAVHDLTLATRNTGDIADLGIAVTNPFESAPQRPPRRA